MIRRYRDDDLEDLLAAWESASRVAHAFLDESFFERERKAIAEQYLPVAETWVQEEEGRVVGFITLIGNEIGGLFVDVGAQGRGIGRGLVDHAMELRGELEVEVFEANAIGRAFYERYGFEHRARSVHELLDEPLLRLRVARS